MLFDMRTYTCRPGTLAAHLALYEKEGLETQSRFLGAPFLYAVTESGQLNSYVHVWAYKSAQDRAERRAALQASEEWKAYLKLSAEAAYLIAQENRLLLPASFFQPKGLTVPAEAR